MFLRRTTPSGCCIDNSGNLLIGGTLPSASTNISLNADGSGEFSSFVIATVDQDYGIVSARKDGTTGSKTAIYLAPANNVVAAGISSTAENDFLSTSNRVASLGFISRNGEPEPTEKARLTPTGNFEVGGLLGTAPNISLNEDGSAEFAGEVQVGAQIRIKGNALSTSNSQVQYNGTVAFGQEVNVIKGDGSVYIGGSDISTGSPNPNISLNADGSATFAEVGVGGARDTGDAAYLTTEGDIVSTRTDPNSKCFYAATVGSTNAFITAGGSASFADHIYLGNYDNTDNTKVGAVYGPTGGIVLRNDQKSTQPLFTIQGGTGTASQEVTATIAANGSASFAGTLNVNGAPVAANVGLSIQTDDIINNALRVTSTTAGSDASSLVESKDSSGDLQALIRARGDLLIGDVDPVNSTANAAIFPNGSADFAGNITAGNVTFNLEPDNPDNYTTTEEEYEVEVPVLQADGPVTADLVDGEPEQEMQTITRTREVTTYTGPTMDVKDQLVKITEALTQLKAATASTETYEELRNAINTALADI